MVQGTPAEEAGHTGGFVPEVAESAGVDHLSGVDEGADDLIVRVSRCLVRAA